MDKELIKKARQANLSEYLLSIGVPLIKSGNRHRHKEHDSLIFTENAYYWNSRQEHGNAIDYLTKHMNMSFKGAVLALTHEPTTISEKPLEQKIFVLDRYELYNNQDKVKMYLNKTRIIGYNVINHLIENKLLFQERETNNAFFPMYDENNNCVGAERQGITGKRFKGIKLGSKYGYGFNVRFTDDNTFDYALFFESAVDLISFIDYKLKYEKKTLNKCILISMAGLKTNIVKHTLKAFQGKLMVVLCVDNDQAGQAFISEIESAKIDYIDKRPNEKYNDWNEQLIDAKQSLKPISRLMSHGLASSQELKRRAQSKTELQEYEQLRL